MVELISSTYNPIQKTIDIFKEKFKEELEK